MIALWVLHSLACTSPAREAALHNQTAVVEAEAGIRLVPVRGGDPVRPWPRLITKGDRLNADLRPMFWAAQVEFEPERAQFLLADDPDATQRRVTAIKAFDRLYDPMRDVLEQREESGQIQPFGLDPAGGVNVLLDAATTAEDLFPALYYAGQARHKIALIGTEGGRLRSVQRYDWNKRCISVVGLSVTSQGLGLVSDRRRALANPAGGCTTLPHVQGRPDLAGLTDTLNQLHQACGPRWAAALPADIPTDEIESDADLWRCHYVETWISPELTADAFLPLLAATSEASGFEPYLPMPDTGEYVQPICEDSRPVSQLTEADLDAWCRADRVARAVIDLGGRPGLATFSRQRPNFWLVKRNMTSNFLNPGPPDDDPLDADD